MIIASALIGLCLTASYFDIKSRRIPNHLVLVGLITAVLWHGLSGGTNGLIQSLQGWAVGMALLFIPFILGGMGAGDVKLLGMIGALQGSAFVINTFLWMALWGGGMALVYLALDGRLWVMIARIIGYYYPPILVKATLAFNTNERADKVTIPYGVAITLGALSTLIWMWY